MSDGIIEIEIKAPEFDRQLKRLGNSMNGTQLTLDEDIRLFKGVEDILLKLPLCKDGDMRAFRFPLPRGTFEEFIMDEYDGEDVDDEELKGRDASSTTSTPTNTSGTSWRTPRTETAEDTCA